ncbi:MAG: GrpE protein [Acidimicrobiaceae bacterium]|nr:GrpE protein [Acidimicrobiaceae bacterium]
MSGEETLADRRDDTAEQPVSHGDGEAHESGVQGDAVESPAVDDSEATSDDGLADEAQGSELAKVTAERDEYLDALRRLQAEFENYRKRTARQQAELLERGSETVIQRVLPALDALDLALAHVGERGDAPGSELDAAFVQIGNLLWDVLAKEGLERIDATGVVFDPTVHDAVAHASAEESAEPVVEDEESEEPSGPAVAEVLRAGYRLKGRVLRPAMVKVRA